METKRECCICGKPLTDFGNEPFPIKSTGRCCNECNIKVIQKREEDEKKTPIVKTIFREMDKSARLMDKYERLKKRNPNFNVRFGM